MEEVKETRPKIDEILNRKSVLESVSALKSKIESATTQEEINSIEAQLKGESSPPPPKTTPQEIQTEQPKRAELETQTPQRESAEAKLQTHATSVENMGTDPKPLKQASEDIQTDPVKHEWEMEPVQRASEEEKVQSSIPKEEKCKPLDYSESSFAKEQESAETKKKVLEMKSDPESSTCKCIIF